MNTERNPKSIIFWACVVIAIACTIVAFSIGKLWVMSFSLIALIVAMFQCEGSER